MKMKIIIIIMKNKNKMINDNEKLTANLLYCKKGREK
jgi:hypothetical protein